MYHELNCPKITEQFSIIRASRDINFLQILIPPEKHSYVQSSQSDPQDLMQ